MVEETLLRLVLYAALCVPTILYLRRKGTPRNLQVTVFVLITGVFIISLFHRLGLFAQLVESNLGIPYLLFLLLIPLAVMGFFAYRSRSLSAFLPFAALVLVMFLYPFLIDITYVQQMGDSSRRFLDDTWFLVCMILGVCTLIQLVRTVIKRWQEGG